MSAKGVGSRARQCSSIVITCLNMKKLDQLLTLGGQEIERHLLMNSRSANFFVQIVTGWSILLDTRHSASML
jgi:hypothetical protein